QRLPPQTCFVGSVPATPRNTVEALGLLRVLPPAHALVTIARQFYGVAPTRSLARFNTRYYYYHRGITMRVTTKGQVTIPQELRRKYQIDTEAEVDFIEEDGKIVLRVAKNSASSFRKLLGRGDVRLSTEEILRLTRAD